jgi:3-oxoadipate enol-lactonase
MPFPFGRAATVLAVVAFFVPSFCAIAQTSPTVHLDSGFLELEGGKMYFEVAGSGHPLVLIHGGQMDLRMWDEQFALFSKSYRVIRYDFRGFGKSPAATKPFSADGDLVALLKYLGLQKTYIVGLSLGGRVAIDFALAHPDMVDAIVPVAPGLSGFHFSDDPTLMDSWRAAQDGDWQKVAELWLKSGYMAPAMENPKIAPRLRQLATEDAHEFLDNGALERVLNPRAIERLPEIKVPTLLIVGDRDVADIHEICGLLYARVPGIKVVLVHNSGHIVTMEQPEEFNRAVLDFLEHLTKQ